MTDYSQDEVKEDKLLDRLNANDELYETWEKFDIKLSDSFFTCSKLKPSKREKATLKNGKERQ